MGVCGRSNRGSSQFYAQRRRGNAPRIHLNERIDRIHSGYCLLLGKKTQERTKLFYAQCDQFYYIDRGYGVSPLVRGDRHD